MYQVHRLRMWTIALIAWLLFIVNVEQSSEKFLNVGRSSDANIIEWYSYVLLAAVALITLIVPILSKVSLPVALPAVAILFLAVKLYFKLGDTWETVDVLRTATELSAIVLTLLLTRQLTRALGEFQEAVAAITIPHVGKLVDAFSASQGEMYQEVRRARQYNRPLALLALKIKENSINIALQAVMKEAQQAMVDELVLAGVAGALCDKLQDYDIIGRQNSYFLVLLPETKREDVPGVINRLCSAVSERAGVKLQVAAATFPDNALTLDGLLQQAVQQIETSTDSTDWAIVPHTQVVLKQS
jgi:GGDEF domain-containing protein